MYPPENLVSFRIWKINHAAAIKTSLTPVNAWAVEDTNEACGDWAASGIRFWYLTGSGSCCVLCPLSVWPYFLPAELLVMDVQPTGRLMSSSRLHTVVIILSWSLSVPLLCFWSALDDVILFGAGHILSKINFFICYPEQNLTFFYWII